MTADPAAGITMGMDAQFELVVGREHTINRTGKPGADVLSTPSMIMLMEQASIRAIDPHLPDGYATVGFHVDVKHFAPSSIGARVVARAEVTGTDGRKIALSVSAFDGETQIGAGTHRRAVISTRD